MMVGVQIPSAASILIPSAGTSAQVRRLIKELPSMSKAVSLAAKDSAMIKVRSLEVITIPGVDHGHCLVEAKRDANSFSQIIPQHHGQHLTRIGKVLSHSERPGLAQ